MIAVVAILVTLVVVPVVSAAVGVDSRELRETVEVDSIIDHLEWLETNGPRPAADPGYDTAAEYVYELLDVGYDVAYQDFTYDLWEELSVPVLERTLPTFKAYPAYPADLSVPGFATMEYSEAGDVTAQVVLAGSFGCDPSDFSGADFSGNIALIERGVCTFATKAINAETAGAAGAIVFNDAARQDTFYGTLGGPVVGIPVVGSHRDVGLELAANDTTVHLAVATVMHYGVWTRNVIAETPGGRDDRVVVVGAHLDTVAEGPGTNDNGSAVATLLEIALQMDELGIEPRNKVVFAFWSAEESGLLGAQYYVDNLTKRERKNIALDLNFDMIASNNYALFVYDGDGSDTPETGPGPNGSGNIEDVFLDYFAEQDLVTWATAFDGRSDYGPFIEAGIPAGGLFTGADGIKTAEQAAIYGGTVGQYYDPYYHTADDTLANINTHALDVMSDAAAHAILTFAMTTSSVNGTGKASDRAIEARDMEYRGPHAQR